MIDKTIQIGIDLGTTNSAVAISNKGNIEIIKNAEGDDYTPSVFGINKAENKVVGRRAYEELFYDPENYKGEVKREMGTSEGYLFERLNKKLSPEEISSEILKYLKESVTKKYPAFDTSAAVITIPAYFSALEAEATKRAGELAGFDYVVLLQEPIAASVSYGFDNSKDENWLIYDLGGGTFDIALVSSKDGALTVRGHNGDNFLGGKDMDNLIIEKIIKPKILENFEIAKFERGNKKYKTVFAKLKYEAEKAKKYLSQDEKTSIEINRIVEDDGGKEIYLSIDITRKELETLVKPLVDKTINLTKKVIKESGIKSSAVTKIILVGGPTQMPYIRERLADDLKIEVDTSVDPLTVVARGACIFGASQRIPNIKKADEKKNKDIFDLMLNYDPMTSEEEQVVTGIIDGLAHNNEEYYVQIQSDDGNYSSEKIRLKKGKFFDNIALEKRKINQFWIYLFDEKGNPVPINPDSFSITQGLSVSGAPIPRTIGIVIAEKGKDNEFRNKCEPFFEKGSILPLKDSRNFFTSRKLIKGEENNALPLWIYEGESAIPDRNTYICNLAITGKDIPYDLPEKTEVNIEIEVNESREVKVNIYVPLIDFHTSVRTTIYDKEIEVSKLDTELLTQKQRLTDLNEDLSTSEKEELENLVGSIDDNLGNSDASQDDKRKADKEIRDLKMKLDSLEKDKETPQLIKEFNTGIVEIEKFIIEIAPEENKGQFREQLSILTSEGNKAIEKEDKTMLIKINEQVRDLISAVILSNPQSWVYHFKQLSTGAHNFKDQTEANYFIEKGNKAMEGGNVEELKKCVVSLIDLLPADEQKALTTEIAGITS